MEIQLYHIVILVLVVLIIIILERLYWLTKLSSSFFINQKVNVMEKETNIVKQIVGFLFSLLAGWLGYAEAPELVLSFGAVLATVYVLTDLMKGHLAPQLYQVFSWGVGIIISLGAWYLQLGIFVDMTWIFAAVTGFIISLAANGVYDSEWLETLWELIRSIFPKK